MLRIRTLAELVAQKFKREVLSPADRDFCREWVRRSNELYGGVALYVMGAFHIGATFYHMESLPEGGRLTFPAWISIFSLGMIGLWLNFRNSRSFKLIFVFVPTVILTMIVQSLEIYSYYNRHFTDGSLPIVPHIGFTMMSSVSIAMIPTSSLYLGAVFSILGLIMQHLAWSPYGDMTPILRLSVVFFISGIFFHTVLRIKSEREARRELHARSVLERYEKDRLEHDLALARRIQDSLLSYNQQYFLPFVAKILHRKYSQVGGDWAAMRHEQDGTLYVLIADAAGKGIQAALVMHAVQSLWAESLGDKTFEPTDWMRRVNRALCHLGAKKPHMVTMGIAKFSHTTCTYISAGHLPLFLVLQPNHETAAEVRILLAPGTPLGLIEDVTLGTAGTAHDQNFLALLGSDGFFSSSSTRKKKEILRYNKRLKSGEDILTETKGDGDDQTLIIISPQSLAS